MDIGLLFWPLDTLVCLFHVSFLVGRVGKGCTTHITLEWFFPCVNIHVPFESPFVNKALVALLAMDWHLTVGCVLCFDVVFKQKFGKPFSTMRTRVGLVMA